MAAVYSNKKFFIDNKQLSHTLFALFSTIADFVAQSECCKSALFLTTHFNPHKLFKSLARSDQLIYLNDLVDYCQNLQHHHDQEDVRLMADLNGLSERITFQNFMMFITPMQQWVLRQSNKRIQLDIQSNRLSDQTHFAFDLLLQKQISFANKISNQRTLLRTRAIKMKQVMNILKMPNNQKPRPTKHFKGHNQHCLTYIQLRRFLEQQIKIQKGGKTFHQNQILNLIRRIHLYQRTDYLTQITQQALKKWLFGSQLRRRISNALRENLYQSRVQQNQYDPILSRSLKKPQRKDIYQQYRQELLNKMNSHLQQQEHQEVALSRTKKIFSQKHKSNLDDQKKEKQAFADYLRMIIETDYQIEQIKNKLVKKKEYNLFQAFKIFDVEKKGVVNSDSLSLAFQRYFKKPGLDFSRLLSRYSKQPGILKFSQISFLLTPTDNSLAKKLHSRNPKQQQFSHETMRLLSSLIIRINENENQIIQGSDHLSEKFDYFYKLIDTKLKGYFTKEQLITFLKANKVTADQHDLAGIWWRWDKDKDNKVSLKQLQFQFFGK